ncbi:hypothetical protein [Acinetobacter sp. SH20PTE14]|uniref:hypothetical protein n=1 Tax=Acinetobacter sp. SH20PTE14 TaxID=2905879 RepID=UPI001F1FDAD7|nr:hypothetical protein [Acinetobacter sp. SH20PTE14]UIJ75245.1 hypothetical protein LXF01_13695 [Acinetobacter sp. SH20PTE14]
MSTSKILTAVLSATLFVALPATSAIAGGKKESKQCGGAPCEGEIDIELQILKACELLVGKDIKLVEDSYTGASGFTVTTNTPYTLNLSTLNAGSSADTFVKHETTSDKVFTKITTSKGGVNYPIGSTPVAGMSVDNFTVSVAPKNTISGTQRAGTYKDTLYIKVAY